MKPVLGGSSARGWAIHPRGWDASQGTGVGRGVEQCCGRKKQTSLQDKLNEPACVFLNVIKITLKLDTCGH